MKRFFLLFSLLLFVGAVGCSEDDQARYADDPNAATSGESSGSMVEETDPEKLGQMDMGDYTAEQPGAETTPTE